MEELCLTGNRLGMIWLCIFWMLLGQLVRVESTTEASIKECISAATRMARRGNGSTPLSCMSCDPTHGVCQDKCQNKVNYLYYACDNICLPDGYYFDPPKLLSGCWKHVKPEVKIAVERCGCNSGFLLKGSLSLVVVVSLIIFSSLL